MKKIIINIGRQFGSGGKNTAEILGQKLGVTVYDTELITEAAKKSGFSKDFLTTSDEDTNFFKLGFNNSFISNNSFFQIQSDAIRNIAEQGSAIFVGRASDYILRDMDCLDVFITSPLEVRAKRISERRSISIEAAEALIAKKDRRREAFYNYVTFGNWGMASNYDLCIDSSILGIEGTADFIIDFAKKKGMI
ncbi:MAG: cytidylate kinase-like family protein [Bacteroidales bacterium]|nr:cytidylate kinase-like family protein [Bacteroidales bacterium]